jgi:hypothetical protein
MDDTNLNDALAMALGDVELPDYIDAVAVQEVANAYATWAFTKTAEDLSPEGITDESLTTVISNAVAASYIAGCLDTALLPLEVPHTTVTGSSGAIYNFYFN